MRLNEVPGIGGCMLRLKAYTQSKSAVRTAQHLST